MRFKLEILFKKCLTFFTLCYPVFANNKDNNPCPNVFRYVTDGPNVYGIIKVEIPTDYGSAINLHVEYSVGNDPGKNNGQLLLAQDVKTTLKNIQNRQPIYFQLRFPKWHILVPKITIITVNKNLICWGNHISPQQSAFVGTVKIDCNITLEPSSGSHSNPSNNRPVPRDEIPDRIQYPFFNPMDPIYKSKLNVGAQPSSSNSTEAQTRTIISTPVFSPKVYVPLTAEPVVSVENICGIVDNNSVQLIVHGEDARKSDYPWLGALFKQSSTGGTFICGATLLTKKHALTAAHCVSGVRPSLLHLILGRADLDQWLSAGEQVQIVDTQVHESSVPRQGDADIAILKLSRNIRFTSAIRPICLWNTDDNLENLVGSTGVVVGWGRDELGTPGTTPRETNMPIVSQEDCLRSHRAYGLLTSTRTFCAGYRNGSGPCSGDSGSGFYMKINDTWFIRGIVSLSLLANNTCDLENYVVFADTAKFKDWILEYING